ncbi:hypothetical protein [Haloferula sp.]|uniref:hypothetical protein n=1 Tax=Haloferula sp. TaxID=2497595 RepID=UPI00329C041F
MKRLPTLTLLLLTGLSTGVGAQSADNFGSTETNVEDLVQKEADEVRMNVIDKETESELLASPSRYAGLDLENYVRALSSSFSMRRRDTDPFARHQDPNFKAAQPVQFKRKVKKFKKEPVTPFSDIIARINVTAVMPAQQSFLVGERNFSTGDRIKLDVGKEKDISVHVVAIAANSVNFRHGVTGETASLSIKLMPDGMSRGKAVHPPGMVPENSDAPLDARPTNPISSRR